MKNYVQLSVIVSKSARDILPVVLDADGNARKTEAAALKDKRIDTSSRKRIDDESATSVEIVRYQYRRINLGDSQC